MYSLVSIGPRPQCYTCDLIKVTCQVDLQNLDCNFTPLVFTLPHFGIPTMIQRGSHPIIARGDLHRSQEQGLMTAYLTQSFQALPPEQRHQAVQYLLGGMGRFRFESVDPFTQDERMGKYFIYHIDKGLSIFPTETTNRPDLIVVGEYLRDQGDAFICGKGTPNQAFPCWKTVVYEQLVRKKRKLRSQS